jgi:primosomal protein N'
LLDREAPKMRFKRFEKAQLAFSEVAKLASSSGMKLSVQEDAYSYAGPRHLARLLLHVADGLDGASLLSTPPPEGVDPSSWTRWCRNRAKSKPLLWRNHRKALATGFLNRGTSAVLVLPTGAGKTTVSELKIAACLGSNRKVIFLVPTLALVDQLRDELAEAFQGESMDTISVSSDGDLLNVNRAGFSGDSFV